MRTTKVFKSGNSMAVRLPKDFHLQGDTVEIIQHENEIIIREIPQHLGKAFQLLKRLPSDFFSDGREDTPPQEREAFWLNPPSTYSYDSQQILRTHKSFFRKKGTPIGNKDLWIAAHAMTLNVTLVTNNIKEFFRIPGLHVENWV